MVPDEVTARVAAPIPTAPPVGGPTGSTRADAATGVLPTGAEERVVDADISALDFEPEPSEAPEPQRGPRLQRALVGEPGVALAALLAGSLAWWFAHTHQLMLLYADARSHLSIARRVLDGPTASMVQLGTVWLPLPHVLVAPFTLVGSWFTSGAAAMPVNLLCLVVEAIALFRIVQRAGGSRLGSWAAVLLMLTNPGWLYLHTTSLSEPVVFACLLAMVAGLSGWAVSDKPWSGGQIALFCGMPAAAGVLARYDGWAMAFAAAVFVFVVAQRRWGQWRYSLKCVRGFAVPPLVAALWWFWFNWRNWGDPLEFQRGPWSAQSQQDLLAQQGLLPDKGDLPGSLGTYLSATLGGAGTWLLAAALLGGLLWLLVGRVRPAALLPWLLVVVPAGFYVMSLYTGQIVVRLENTGTESMFNLRYGLQLLPGLVALAGLGVAVVERLRPPLLGRVAAVAATIALLVGSAATWVGDWRSVPVVAEGLQQQRLGAATQGAADALAARLGGPEDGGGFVMVDDSVHPVLPWLGADFDRVWAPFSGNGWIVAQEDPRRAEWLLVDSANGGDAVDRALRTFEERAPGSTPDFDEVYRDDTVRVLHNPDAEPAP